MRKIVIFIWCSMPLMAFASNPELSYKIKLVVDETWNLHADIDIVATKITTDTLHFDFGNALIEYWGPTLSLSDNCFGYRLDTITTAKRLCIPTHGKEVLNLSLSYDFVPFVAVFTRSQAVLYDNRGYENFLPNFTDSCNLKIERIQIECPAGFEVLYPYDVKSISDFYLLAYRTSDCRDRDKRCIGEITMDYRLFTDSLSLQDKNLLFNRVYAFCETASEGLGTLDRLKRPLHIVEMPWMGNTNISDMMVYDGSSFRSTILYHELMHLWITPELFDDEIRGKYFLSETLNEYMMCQYIRKMDLCKYEALIENKRDILAKGIKQSEPLVDVMKYVNSNHNLIMVCGVIALDDFGHRMGQDEFLEFLEGFISRSRLYKYGYEDFKQQLAAKFGYDNLSDLTKMIETFRGGVLEVENAAITVAEPAS